MPTECWLVWVREQSVRGLCGGMWEMREVGRLCVDVYVNRAARAVGGGGEWVYQLPVSVIGVSRLAVRHKRCRGAPLPLARVLIVQTRTR